MVGASVVEKPNMSNIFGYCQVIIELFWLELNNNNNNAMNMWVQQDGTTYYFKSKKFSYGIKMY